MLNTGLLSAVISLMCWKIGDGMEQGTSTWAVAHSAGFQSKGFTTD